MSYSAQSQTAIKLLRIIQLPSMTSKLVNPIQLSFDATLPVVSNTNRLHFCTRLKKEAKEASFVVLLPTCISLVMSPVRCLIFPLKLAYGRTAISIKLIFAIQYIVEHRFELKIITKKLLLGAEIDPRTSRLKGHCANH